MALILLWKGCNLKGSPDSVHLKVCPIQLVHKKNTVELFYLYQHLQKNSGITVIF